ncbi:hypothetical protein [Streptomyces sp. NPDC059278]|uniref:hypothetical protein n=1 Tax=Streptomyces sp. NPDC059278 TaxID=3346801 RepID=UPI0036B3D654
MAESLGLRSCQQTTLTLVEMRQRRPRSSLPAHPADLVSFNSFAFQESDDSLVPVPYAQAYERGGFLTQHARRIDVYSGAHTHDAEVRVRVWDLEPETGGGPWGRRDEIDFESATGYVAIWSTVHGRLPDLIGLGAPGRWRVRVSCSGRAEAKRVSEQEGVAYGVEKYVVDFWLQR